MKTVKDLKTRSNLKKKW